ncbi:MAG: biopolymer transporter ExbD [Synergistaceae bacterium]|jgi:biopolymer transport protein ExbD|nr:biopolymer transporter ExbD [Synergistaceae bacterium]
MRGRRGADIDITPLIDVLFMLIIFFVLTAVFVQGAIELDLPRGGGENTEKQKPVIVSITKEARVYWAGEPVEPSDLARLVSEASIASDDILIAGDREAPYGAVAELLDTLRGLGVESVNLIFEENREK